MGDASRTFCFRSSVSRSRSSSDLKIAWRRLSSSRSWPVLSRTAMTSTSSRLPVASFLYLAMKGTVAP